MPEHRRPSLLQKAPVICGALVVLLLLAALAWFAHGLMNSKSQKQARTVQNITVIRPPPPPPPPPETPPPPPPPDKVEQQLPQNEPEPTPDNTPTPSQQLGLDADGAAGDDGFGLAARKGGSDIAGSGGAAFAWYTGKLKDEVNDRLSSDAKLRGKKFTVGIRIWLESDGRIKDVKMTTGTGNRDLDSAISSDIAALGRLSASPPIEMPQPISLQIVSRS
jgi:periplasmic protein TonB